MDHKRLSLFAGHYGSGKTNIAVSYALHLRRLGKQVSVVDLDIVNPYFRTKDSLQELQAAGIRLIASPYANSNVDLPALPQEIYGVLGAQECFAVLDIGGDDRGALALGRYAPAILEENNYEMLMVINRYRPLTATVEDTLEVMREIEIAGGIPFTGLVNNSNLGKETTPEDVLSSVAYGEAVAKASGLPLKMTTVKRSLYPLLQDKISPLFPLELQAKYYDSNE